MELIINNSIKNLFDTSNKSNNTFKTLDNIILLRKIMFQKIKNNLENYPYSTFSNIISYSLCDFIIDEAEKYALNNITTENIDGWTKKRHSNYPTNDLPVKDIPTLNTLINNIIKYDIFPFIEKTYNVNKYFLDCNDIFIVKYKYDQQSNLDRHKDGCAFSFNILLNNENDFEGGGTIIEENGKDILVNNTKGSLVLHSGQVFHSGNKITKGIRYILVGFVSYLKGYDINHYNSKTLNHKIKFEETNSDINILSWNLDINKLYYNNLQKYILENKIDNKTIILNINKPSFSIVEKIIIELASFHLKRLGYEIDFNKYKIEYWWKNDNKSYNGIIHKIHSDKDEVLMHKYNILMIPLLSTVTYINDSLFPTVVTSTHENKMKDESLFNLNNGIVLSFPKKMKHICFNGRNLHGVGDIFNLSINNNIFDNRQTLMFNIWNNHTPLERTTDNNIYNNYFLENMIINEFKETLNKKEIKLKRENMIESVNNIINNNYYILNKYVNKEDNNDLIYFDLE